MKMTVVLTLATPDYAERWKFCLDSQARYAKRFGYDHVCNDRPVAGLDAFWSKLHLALGYLNAGSDVLLIDADAEITSRARPFTEVLRRFPTKDIFYVLGISGRPNSGVLMLRGGQSHAVAFLNVCLANVTMRLPKADRAPGENGHVIYFLKKEPFASASHELLLRWNCSRVASAANAYIRHFTNELRRALEDGSFHRID